MLWGALSKRGGASNVVGEYMINGFSGCYLSGIVFRRADGPWEDDVHNSPPQFGVLNAVLNEF